jgi:uncharacterized membrane protein
MVGFAGTFGALSWLRHLAFSTGRFDLGNMTQAVWSTAHGRPLEMTELHGEQISRLAAHVDPILVAFVPLWWLWPSPAMLVVAQAVALALGALPVYWLARKHLPSERHALGFAVVYLAYPTLQWLALAEFHPVALACPLLLYAFWYLDERRLAAAIPFLVLATLTKEEVGLVVAAMGLWHGRRAGLAIAAAGMAWTAFAVGVVVPHFNAGGSSEFYGRYDDVGGSPRGVVETAFTEPWRLLEVAFDARGWSYLAALLLPLLVLPLLAPLTALVAVPELALNLLSSTKTQTSVHFHYTAALIPPLLVAAIFGARRAPRVVPFVVAACVVGGWLLGPLPFWRYVPGGETLGTREHIVTRHDAATRAALRLVPGDAPVSATNRIGAHLSERERIFSFPVRRESEWIVVDVRHPSWFDAADEPEKFNRALRALRGDPSWHTVFARSGVFVFRRAPAAGRGTPRAPA